MTTEIEQAFEDYANELGSLLADLDFQKTHPAVAMHMAGSAILATILQEHIRSFIDKRLKSQNAIIDYEMHDIASVRAEAKAYRKLCDTIGIDWKPEDHTSTCSIRYRPYMHCDCGYVPTDNNAVKTGENHG